MKLPAFPVPQLGETVSSAVARFLIRTAGPVERKLGFLSLKRAAATALMPPNVQALVDAMPLGHPWSDAAHLVLSDHTLVPLYLHFAHPIRVSSAMQSLLGGQCLNPVAALGISTSAATGVARRTRFCPQCIETDLATRGFPVIYREHQPEFVKLCAIHKTPLRLSCANCLADRNAARMWRMAGKCECASPNCPPAIELGHDPVSDAGWLWLSRQVRLILSARRFPAAPLLPVIRQSLGTCGLLGRRGVDNAGVFQALETRFGRNLLAELDALPLPGSPAGQLWPGRLLGNFKAAGDRVPDLMRSLLLSALVVSDVVDLADVPVVVDSSSDAEPNGYSGERQLARTVLSREVIEQALGSSCGNIFVASNQLRVSAAVLAVDMRRSGLRLHLSTATTRRLGPTKLEAIRAALRSGEAKYKIARRLGVSDWTVQLVELDDPELAVLHRRAAIEAQRSKHRDALTRYLDSHPNAGRLDVYKACPAASDWLYKFDRTWLSATLPKRKAPPAWKRRSRRQWGEIDQAFAVQIAAVSESELAKSTRPLRLTATRLLALAGVTVAANERGKQLLPLASAAAQEHAESEVSFYRRKLSWALNECKALEVAVSTKLLVRISGIPTVRLRMYRDHIIAEASRLGISIDARSCLSPLGQSASKGRAVAGAVAS